MGNYRIRKPFEKHRKLQEHIELRKLSEKFRKETGKPKGKHRKPKEKQRTS